ncbi:MAG: chitobiase/beta-hexosaminidase C-terminal domain-containing protein [Prevotella sp.]|nr:chitobiase/beta-hexosaminidase C-terminal domain-containing protein [Prevotella sp.]
MNKILRFSLITLLMMLCGTTFALEKTFSASEISGAATEAITINGVTFEAAKNTGSNAPQFVASGQDFRIYAKGTLSVSTTGTITKMVFNISAQGLKRLAPITASTGTIAEQASGDAIVTWTGEAESVTLTVGDKANYGTDGDSKAGQLDFSSVTITYDYNGTIVEKVATPVISPDGGEFDESVEVTLSCATEGATIMYCLANDWEAYTGPITLTETTIVRAYAVCDGMENSETVSAEFTKKEQEGQLVTFDFNKDYKTLFPTIKGESSGNSNAGDITEEVTATVGDVSVTVSPATGNTPNRIWSSDPRLRMYSGTLTFASTGDNITKIEFTQTTNKARISDDNTAEPGDLTKTNQQNNGTVTWTGNSKSVVINIAGNTQYSMAVVTLGEVKEQVAAPVFTPDGGEFTDSVDVTLTCATEGATIMYCVANDWEVYTEPIRLKETTVLGAYAVCDGMVDSETVRVTFTKKEVVPEPETISVAEALEIIDGMEDKAIATEASLIEGYVVSISDINTTTFGNATYVIADEPGATENTLTVYRGFYLDNAKFTDADQLCVGNKVVVNGKLQRYVDNSGKMIPEVSQGNYLVSIEVTGNEPADQEVASIAEFNALEKGSKALLTLNNEVQVVFSQKAEDGKEWVIVQDNQKSRVVFYNTGLFEKVQANDMLTGSIAGIHEVYFGMNEFTAYSKTTLANVNAVAGNAIKVDALANVAAAWDPYKILKLCKISKVTYTSENNHFYATDGSDKTLEIRDNFRVGYTLPELQEGQSLNITGIVVPYVANNSTDTIYQIAPISQEAIEVVYPPYYKQFAETEVFIPTAEALAEAMTPEAAWVEWGGTRTDNKTLHINPYTDEEEVQKNAPGIGLKSGNSAKSFSVSIQGVEAVWAYGSSTGSAQRTLRVTATDESGQSVTAQETTDGQTATIKVNGLNPQYRYHVVFSGLDGDGSEGKGADVVLHAVKFLPIAPIEAKPGDVNSDGEVGIGDIVAITNVMAGIFQEGMDEEAINALKARADVNGDGNVGIGDIVAITNIMAGIESSTTEP